MTVADRSLAHPRLPTLARFPERAKRMLLEEGLLSEPSLGLDFSILGDLERYEEALRQLAGTDLLPLGRSAAGLFCLSPEASCVVSVEEHLDAPRFVNTDLQSLDRFISLFRQERVSAIDSGYDDEDVVLAMQRLRRMFDEIDPVALSDPDYWWAEIIIEGESLA